MLINETKKRYKRTLKVIFILLFIAGVTYLQTEPLYTPTAIVVNSHMIHLPSVTTYRAIISGDFPSNSLAAVQESLNSSIDGIKVDVRMSKDGVLFLYQGDDLAEYTNGSGKPENHNWEDLAKLAYQVNLAHPIITLDDFLNIVGTQKTVFLNIKPRKIFDQNMAKNVVNVIRKYHLQENVFVESCNPIFLIIIRLVARDIMVMYDFVNDTRELTKENKTDFVEIPWLLKQHWIQKQFRRIIRPDVLGVNSNFDQAIIKHLVANHYPIITWNLDDPEIALNLYKIGIKGFQTNKPLLIQDVLPQKHKISYDAGGTKSTVEEIINIHKIDDVLKVVKRASKEGKKITIAGRRHSMGGQALLDNSLQLNMLPLSQVTYNCNTKTVIAQAGATWKKVQDTLNNYNRSIKVMQSDNIFTVGGSISVNVHGWQVASPPIASTIVAMTVVTPAGEVKKISKTLEPDLFKAVIGGYGMFAIIIDAELATVENSAVVFRTHFTTPPKIDEAFKNYISNNPKVELAYARLSVDQNNLFEEAGLFWYENQGSKIQTQKIKPESLVALKRSFFRLSEYHNWGKKLRWLAEKVYVNNMAKGSPIARNDAMNTDIHILWTLYGNNKDILHEYFIPKTRLDDFITVLKANILKYGINTLNVTIREVQTDNISLLPYANQDVFGLVCLFSQRQTDNDEEVMKNFTCDTINKALNLGGTFYLPYRLHYNTQQLLKAYPLISKWLEKKKQYDPHMVLNSQFFEYISKLI